MAYSTADTLLFMVQTACAELGLPIPGYVTGNPDVTTTQMLAHLNKVGRDLVKMYEWSSLITEPYVITTVANQEFYPFPTGFDRIVGNTAWDRTMHWQLLGPDSPQLARFRRESLISVASPRIISRQEGNNLSLYPIATQSGETIVFDYVSRLWAITGATLIPAYTMGAPGCADTDYCLFDSNLVIKGVKSSFMAAKGMATADALNNEFLALLKICMAADQGGSDILSMLPADRIGDANADVAAGAQLNVILNEGGDFLLVE